MARALIVFTWFTLLVVIAAVCIWLVLAAPLFSDFRKKQASAILSEQIGQPLSIQGDVRVYLAPVSRIFVSDVEIPSENLDDLNLAELDLLELDLDLIALAQGLVNFDNLTVDGLRLNILRKGDGTKSWSEGEQAALQDSQSPEAQRSIIQFLSGRTVKFSGIQISRINEKTGFVFNFDLDSLNLLQKDNGHLTTLTGRGGVNGQAFEIDASFPKGADFTTRARFGEVELSFDGRSIPSEGKNGFEARLSLDTGAFSGFLDVLGLDPVLDGTGTLTANMTSIDNKLAIEDLVMQVDLADGQLITATGSTADLIEGIDTILEVQARLHPEGEPPARAQKFEDLTLSDVEFRITGDRGNLSFEQIYLGTNSFESALERVGPVSIGGLHRTEDGHLALREIAVKAGPPDAPYLDAKGGIENVLALQDLAFSGKLQAKADVLLGEIRPEAVERFGGVAAEFAFDDVPGHLNLSRFEAKTFGTDLWSFEGRIGLENPKTLKGLAISMDLDIPQSKEFLEALNLEPVDAGELELLLSLSGDAPTFDTQFDFTVDASRLEWDAALTVDPQKPVLKGSIHSTLLDLADIRDGAAALVQLNKLLEEGTVSDFEPLVLPDEEEEAAATEDDEFQPLVLGDEEPTFELSQLLSEGVVELDINIEKISGQQGISKIDSQITLMDGVAEAGPVEVTYGGGYFRVFAGMDLINAPDRLAVRGATSGWDFGEILASIGIDMQAHGRLRADFDFSGNLSSLDRYLRTMTGAVTVSMRDGKIATSLLELAGLGIFPWLFSSELQKGYTDIVCVVAPLRFQAGSISTSATVVETKSVQLVAAGQANLNKKTLSLRAEPRPVGRPLARSAWPFTVTGTFDEPQFKLQVGGTRRKPGNAQVAADRTPCKPDIRQLENQ